jgi:hypothetical protein
MRRSRSGAVSGRAIPKGLTPAARLAFLTGSPVPITCPCLGEAPPEDENSRRWRSEESNFTARRLTARSDNVRQRVHVLGCASGFSGSALLTTAEALGRAPRGVREKPPVRRCVPALQRQAGARSLAPRRLPQHGCGGSGDRRQRHRDRRGRRPRRAGRGTDMGKRHPRRQLDIHRSLQSDCTELPRNHDAAVNVAGLFRGSCRFQPASWGRGQRNCTATSDSATAASSLGTT